MQLNMPVFHPFRLILQSRNGIAYSMVISGQLPSRYALIR